VQIQSTSWEVVKRKVEISASPYRTDLPKLGQKRNSQDQICFANDHEIAAVSSGVTE
jgi:hypothetical protein